MESLENIEYFRHQHEQVYEGISQKEIEKFKAVRKLSLQYRALWDKHLSLRERDYRKLNSIKNQAETQKENLIFPLAGLTLSHRILKELVEPEDLKSLDASYSIIKSRFEFLPEDNRRSRLMNPILKKLRSEENNSLPAMTSITFPINWNLALDIISREVTIAEVDAVTENTISS